MMISLAMVAGFFTLALSQSRIASNISKSTKAYYAAESAIEDVAYMVNSGATVPDPYSTTINGVPLTMSFNSESDTYTAVATVGSDVVRKVSIAQPTTSGTSVSFPYVIQAGYGGLRIQDGPQIHGDVYSNGSVTGDNSSSIAGSAIVAAGYVASNRAPEVSYANEAEATVAVAPVRNITAQKYIIQSFSAPAPAQVTRVWLRMSKKNNPSVSLTIKLYSDSNGAPNTLDAYGTGTISPSNITGGATPEWYAFTLTSTSPLIEGSRYWLHIGRNDVSDKNYYNVYTNTKDAILLGAKYGQNNGNWTDVADQKTLLFKLQIGESETSYANYGVSPNTQPCENTIAKAWKFLNIPSVIKAKVLYGSGTAPSTSCAGVPATNYGSDHPMPIPFPISKAKLDEWADAIKNGGFPCTIDECGDLTNYSGIDGGDLYLPLSERRSATYIPGNMELKSSASNSVVLNLKGLLYIDGDLTLTGTDLKPCTIQLDNDNNVFDSGRSGYIIVKGRVIIDRCRIFGVNNSKVFIISLSSNNAYPAILVRPYGTVTSANGAKTHNDTPASVLYAPNGLVQVQGPYSRFAAIYGAQVLLNNSPSSTLKIEYSEALKSVVFPSVTDITQVGLSFWRETAY